jgi:hypothetical protein
MALDFQQMQSGLEVAALAKWDATDDTEVVVRSMHNGERYETQVSDVDCEYTMPESNGTIRIVINLERSHEDSRRCIRQRMDAGSGR